MTAGINLSTPSLSFLNGLGNSGISMSKLIFGSSIPPSNFFIGSGIRSTNF